MADEIGGLAFLNDRTLFKVAQSAVAPDLTAEMDALLARKGREGISIPARHRVIFRRITRVKFQRESVVSHMGGPGVPSNTEAFP